MAGDGGELIYCYNDDVWNMKLEAAQKSKKLIVLYFNASWCPPCCLIDDFVVECAKQFPNVVFFEVNVEELPNVVLEFSVTKLPTFILMKEDKILDKVVRTKVVGAAKDDYRRGWRFHRWNIDFIAGVGDFTAAKRLSISFFVSSLH
ncbi:unnamed protein product [Microthlaspi erraticum]|uniref:Thioredoxin domain-containing protein n=1 Tax=Microthlaspi erraticum TaxID=1685480 RepID=A0A6D2IY22_9BRAS|nr:unnamed protein product [Microthlaspi erraticum]